MYSRFGVVLFGLSILYPFNFGASARASENTDETLFATIRLAGQANPAEIEKLFAAITDPSESRESIIRAFDASDTLRILLVNHQKIDLQPLITLLSNGTAAQRDKIAECFLELHEYDPRSTSKKSEEIDKNATTAADIDHLIQTALHGEEDVRSTAAFALHPRRGEIPKKVEEAFLEAIEIPSLQMAAMQAIQFTYNERHFPDRIVQSLVKILSHADLLFRLQAMRTLESAVFTPDAAKESLLKIMSSASEHYEVSTAARALAGLEHMDNNVIKAFRILLASPERSEIVYSALWLVRSPLPSDFIAELKKNRSNEPENTHELEDVTFEPLLWHWSDQEKKFSLCESIDILLKQPGWKEISRYAEPLANEDGWATAIISLQELFLRKVEKAGIPVADVKLAYHRPTDPVERKRFPLPYLLDSVLGRKKQSVSGVDVYANFCTHITSNDCA